MKLLFKLLQLFPAFQKLLNEHFESERKELEKQVEAWQGRFLDMRTAAERYATESQIAARRIEQLAKEGLERLDTIRARDAEIERLQNATTAKLKAVDALDSESVFNATLYSPRTTPRD